MAGEGCHCRDWMGKYEGKSRLALKPQTTEQVSQILKHCNDRQLAVVPQVSITSVNSILSCLVVSGLVHDVPKF